MKQPINKISMFNLLKFFLLVFLLLGLTYGQSAEAANPPPVQTFYVPIPEGQLYNALKTSCGTGCTGANTVSDTVRSVISIAIVADGTWIYYDHWEDGYEVDISNPTSIYSNPGNLKGTQIWGDGNPSNGYPPGFPSDILKAGDVIVLAETINRNNPGALLPATAQIPYSHIPFNGGDKFAASNTVAVTRSGWAVIPGSVLADAVEVYDTNLWSTSFKVPVGENVVANNIFNYTGLVIQAARNGTTVTVGGRYRHFGSGAELPGQWRGGGWDEHHVQQTGSGPHNYR